MGGRKNKAVLLTVSSGKLNLLYMKAEQGEECGEGEQKEGRRGKGGGEEKNIERV